MTYLGLRNYLFRGLTFLFFIIPLSANAIEIKLHPGNKSANLTAVLVTGDIEPGDTSRLADFIHNLPKTKNIAVYLSSRGGNLDEGLSLGVFFRSKRIKTVLDGGGVCFSACALAFLGGTDKKGEPWRSSSTNAQLGFHAFRYVNQELVPPDEVQQTVAKIIAYGKKVDTPIDLLIANFATPSDKIHIVSNDEICRLGIKLWSVDSDRFICNE
jgi:hypothetical protein